MQAIEFETQLRNGIIELPAQFQPYPTQTVRVIILLDNPHTPLEPEIMPKTFLNPELKRPLGLLKGQLNAHFADDFNMTEEEFLQS